MKNRIPNDNEWKKIVDDAFTAETEHVFSDKYNRQKAEMTSNISMTKNRNSRRILASAAAVIAAAVVIPSSVIAYGKLTAKIEKTADYRNTVEIKAPAEAAEGYKYYEYSVIPDGFEYAEMDNFWGYYRESTGDGIQTQFFCLPEGRELNIDLLFSGSYETYTVEGKTALISYRISYDEGNSTNYGREVFICFDDTPYFMNVALTDGVTDEELKAFIDGARLIETEEQQYGTYIPWLDIDTTDYTYKSIEKFDIEKANILKIGDTAYYPHIFEGDLFGYDVTVNSIELTDSFDGIYTDGCGNVTDYSDLMDENGNVAENTRIYTTVGDGIYTLDEVVYEEEMPLHILKISTTYTNTTDSTDRFCIDPRLMSIDGDTIDIDWTLGYTAEHGADRYYNSLRGRFEERTLPFSIDIGDEVTGGINFVVLEPGQSKDVELRYFVTDDMLETLHLSFVTSGNSYSSSLNSGYPVFDIRQ